MKTLLKSHGRGLVKSHLAGGWSRVVAGFLKTPNNSIFHSDGVYTSFPGKFPGYCRTDFQVGALSCDSIFLTSHVGRIGQGKISDFNEFH